MADLSIPRTPSPVHSASKTGGFTLTPPPTTQAIRHASFPSAPERRLQNAKSINKPNRVPTVEEVRSFGAEECREQLLEILPLLGETRMTLAHTQLQLNLLNIEATEAAQRAEVEHEMMRREAEVLRAGSPILYNRRATIFGDQSPFPHMQRQLEIALEAGRDLEADNFQLKHRLRQAKKIIKQLSGQKVQLTEENYLLRQRIKQNRAHVDATKSADASPNVFPLPRARASRPIRSATPAQNPLDALLMADQILSGNPSSMPATPSPHRLHRPRNGHTRGVQSLSSLPSTPTRPRRLSATDLRITPSNRATYTNPATPSYLTPAQHTREVRLREDRDGTISASEDDALTDDDTIATSQASQVAANMLKTKPPSGAQYPWMRPVASTAAPAAVMHTSTTQPGNPIAKTVAEGKDDRPRKKAKLATGHVGLGIRELGSPA